MALTLTERLRVNLAKRFLYSDGKDLVSRVCQHLFVNQPTGTSHFTNYESYLLAIKRISWVYSCVTVISYTAASNPWELYKRGTDEVIEKHPYRDLLENPNEFQTYMDYTEEGVQHLVLTGNWYEAHEGNNAKGQPQELFNLRPPRVTILPSKTELIAGYVHEVAGAKVPFETSEILHYRFPNPTDELYGLGVIEAGENLFNTEFHSQISLLSFFANRAQPSGILKVKGDIDEDDWELVKAGWREHHGGSKRRYGTAFLKGNLEYQQIGLDPGHIQQVEISKATRDMILAMMGVPLGKLGIRETSEVKDDKEDRFFYKETINPLLVRIAQRRSHWLKRVGWGDVEWRPELRTFDDDTEKIEVAKGMAQTYSFTRNEIRKVKGEEPLKSGGDVIVIPMTMTEVEVDLAVKAVASVGVKALKGRKLAAAILKSRQVIEKQVIEIFRPKIGDFFSAQSKRVIQAGAKIKKNSELKLEKIWDAKAEDAALTAAIRPLHVFVVEETVAGLRGLLGRQEKKIEPGIFPEGWEFPNLDKFLAAAATKVSQVNQTTKDAIAGELAEGYKRGYSVYQMMHGVEAEDYKGILGVFEQASTYRAEMIARTETMNVYKDASLETYKSVGMQKVEVADGLLPTSDADCRARDGQVWTIEDARAFEDHPNGSFTVIPWFKD